MKLLSLLRRLPPDSYEIHSGGNTEVEIETIKILTGTEQEYSREVLYFCFPGAAPEPGVSAADSSFFLSEAYPPSLRLSEMPRANVFVLQKGYTLSQIFNLMQEALEQEVKIGATINRMTQTYFRCASLRQLVEEGYRVFGNPVIVELPSRRRLAQCVGKGPFGEDDPLLQFLRDESSMDYIMESGESYFDKLDLIEQLREASHPLMVQHDRAGVRMLASPVRVMNVNAARAFVLEHQQPFREGDEELLAHFAMLVGQEMQKDSYHSKNRGSSLSFILIDMLRNEHIDPETAHFDLQRVKYTLRGKYQMAVLHSNVFPCPDQAPSHLRGVLVGHLHAIYEDNLVIMFNMQPHERLNDYVLGELRQLAQANNMTFGLSNAFNSIIYIRGFYRQALNAAIAGNAILNEPLVEYRNIAYLDMIDVCRQSRNLLDFIDPDLFAMIEDTGDDQNRLAQTLYHYLIHYGNTAKTAQALHIHKNTLLYRLGKLRALLGSSLDHGEDMFRYYLTFKILANLKMFGVETYDQPG